MSAMKNLHTDGEIQRWRLEALTAQRDVSSYMELLQTAEVENEKLRELLAIAETSLVAVYAAHGLDPFDCYAIRKIRAANKEQSS